MQVRKLISSMKRNSGQFKTALLESIPVLINETEHLKKQWRVQIVAYIALDVLILLSFSVELQFIIFQGRDDQGRDCLVAAVPLVLFMLNVAIHLGSFIVGIAILNDSFSQIESTAWRCTGWKLPSHERTPEQINSMKDPELGILLLGLSSHKMMFRIGPVTIDWAFIWTVITLAGTLYGLAIPS